MFKNNFFKKVASCCLTLAGVLSLSMPCNAHIYGTDSYCDNEWKSFLSDFCNQRDSWREKCNFKNEKIQLFYWCRNNSEYLNVFYVNSDYSYHKDDYYSSEQLYGDFVIQNLNKDDLKCSCFYDYNLSESSKNIFIAKNERCYENLKEFFNKKLHNCLVICESELNKIINKRTLFEKLGFEEKSF